MTAGPVVDCGTGPQARFGVPGDGELLWGAGSQVAVRLGAEHSGGRLGATHFKAALGETAPLHRHTHEDELFLVAEGEVLLHVDGIERVVTGGGVAYLPRGTAHGYRVLAPDSSFFVVTTPGGFERFFAAGGLDPADPSAAEQWTRTRTQQINERLDIGLEWITHGPGDDTVRNTT